MSEKSYDAYNEICDMYKLILWKLRQIYITSEIYKQYIHGCKILALEFLVFCLHRMIIVTANSCFSNLMF